MEASQRHHDDPDLLSRWMAHEIAEAMYAADAEGPGSPAADRARTLILELWERRTTWPRGWPPEEAVKQLRGLAPANAPFPRVEVDAGSPWLAHAAGLMRIASDESRTFLMAGLLQTGVDAQREALKGATGDDDDVWTLRRLVDLHDEALRWAADADGTTPEEVAALARAELELLAARRQELIAAVIEDRTQPPQEDRPQ